jgi:16S rRNA (guanine1516-N2)-methyltransferase
MMELSIGVSTNTQNLETEAMDLAKQLGLSFSINPEDFDYLLFLAPKHLSLIKTGEKMLPLFVDFLDGKMAYRRQHASLRNEALARALGLNHRTSPRIVDATAGMARDSFILASLGFDVQLLERSPIIHALITDGIKRALENPHVAPIVSRLHLINADAITWLQQCVERPDIIYLDPMFPSRQKTALVKKEMRIFQNILGDDMDAEALLQAALACALKRVVVKRPRLAEAIEGPIPSFSMKGSSSRFDIYLIEESHGKLTSVT